MNRFCPAPGPKLGSTATPSRPRSKPLQIELVGIVSAVVFVVPWRTIRTPTWRVIRRRPSGVKSRAVGAVAAVTSSSTKPEGRAADAGRARPSVKAAMRRAFMAEGANVECRIMNREPYHSRFPIRHGRMSNQESRSLDSRFAILDSLLLEVPQHVDHEMSRPGSRDAAEDVEHPRRGERDDRVVAAHLAGREVDRGDRRYRGSGGPDAQV